MPDEPDGDGFSDSSLDGECAYKPLFLKWPKVVCKTLGLEGFNGLPQSLRRISVVTCCPFTICESRNSFCMFLLLILKLKLASPMSTSQGMWCPKDVLELPLPPTVCHLSRSRSQGALRVKET